MTSKLSVAVDKELMRIDFKHTPVIPIFPLL